VTLDHPIFVRCPRCRHEGTLSVQAITDAGLKPDRNCSALSAYIRPAGAQHAGAIQRLPDRYD
jgi:hypothetical protein